jgi:hypothetical protein
MSVRIGQSTSNSFIRTTIKPGERRIRKRKKDLVGDAYPLVSLEGTWASGISLISIQLLLNT